MEILRFNDSAGHPLCVNIYADGCCYIGAKDLAHGGVCVSVFFCKHRSQYWAMAGSADSPGTGFGFLGCNQGYYDDPAEAARESFTKIKSYIETLFGISNALELLELNNALQEDRP